MCAFRHFRWSNLSTIFRQTAVVKEMEQAGSAISTDMQPAQWWQVVAAGVKVDSAQEFLPKFSSMAPHAFVWALSPRWLQQLISLGDLVSLTAAVQQAFGTGQHGLELHELAFSMR